MAVPLGQLLALGAGERDVEEAALLLRVEVAGRDRLAEELDGEELGAALAGRPLALEEHRDEDVRVLEPLRLVERHQPDPGRVVGQLDARLELAPGRLVCVEVVDEVGERMPEGGQFPVQHSQNLRPIRVVHDVVDAVVAMDDGDLADLFARPLRRRQLLTV